MLWLAVSAAVRAPAQTLPGGWLPDAGLHHLALRTLVQAPDGLLWVGTDDGVYRYDGTDLVPLNALLRSGAPLPATACNHLLTAPDGTLWLGTEAGVYCFTRAGQLRAIPLPAPTGNNRLINGLEVAPDRRHVWVAQEHGGLRAYHLNGQPAAPLIPETQARHGVWVAPDGTLWLTLDDGSTRHLAPDGRVLGQWRHDNHILHPVADPTGRVWLLNARAAYRPVAGQPLVALAWWDGGRETRSDITRTDTSAAIFTREQILQLSWSAGPDPRPLVRFGVPLPPWHTAGWSAHICTDAVGNWWIFDTGARGCWRRTATPAFIRPLAGPGGRPYSVRTIARLPDGRLLVSAYEAGLLIQAADSPLAPAAVEGTARGAPTRADESRARVPRPRPQ